MEEININTKNQLEDFLNSNSLQYGNIGVCSLHGTTDENCYIKLKKNQTVIINFFSNLMTFGIDEFEDNTIFMERKLIDPAVKSKIVPEHYMWNILLKNIKDCQYKNLNYNDCLNTAVNSLNKLNPQDRFGLFTGNDIDYNKIMNPILQRNISVNYVPNVNLYRDKNNRDFAQYFYDFTQNKVFFFRTNINNKSEYIADLKELIEKYYGENEFILFVTSCRILLNDITDGTIHNGLIIDNHFNIEDYLMNDSEKIIMNENRKMAINFVQNKFEYNQAELSVLINSLNNKEIKTLVNFIKTNKILEAAKKDNSRDIILKSDINRIFNMCKYIEFIKNYEYHINYALYELLHTNILEIPKFKNTEINDHSTNIKIMANIYDNTVGQIITQLKKIFKNYYSGASKNNNSEDEFINNIFDITSNLIVVIMEIISGYDSYISNNFENLYEHLPDMIKIIYSSANDPKSMTDKNVFTDYLKYFIGNQKKNLLEKKDISTFVVINSLLYDIRQIIIGEKNDLYKNINIKNKVTKIKKANEVGEIFKIILNYMQKMMFLNDFLKSKNFGYIHMNNEIVDNILDSTMKLIKLSVTRKYYSKTLFNKITQKYGSQYLFADYDNDGDPNIKYLSRNLNESVGNISHSTHIKNTFNIQKLNIKKETVDFFKQMNYDIKKNPCFLYEFVAMLRSKNLFVYNDCYRKKNINKFIKWVASNFFE